MKKERLLISEDKAAAEREIQRLESQIPIINNLIMLFNGLDLGKLDEKTALSLLVDNGATAGEMFLNAIAADCYATGNKNKHFVNQQVKAQEQTVLDFKNNIKTTLAQTERSLDYRKFSYSESDGYFVSEQSKESIIEKHKKYLSDPEEIEIYNEFKKTFETLQNLDVLITKRTGKNAYYSLAPYFESVNFQNQTTQFFNSNKILELLERNR